jgi:hypothetical protein
MFTPSATTWVGVTPRYGFKASVASVESDERLSRLDQPASSITPSGMTVKFDGN